MSDQLKTDAAGALRSSELFGICVRYGCWRTPLKYMRVDESHQTTNGFFTIKVNGYYCPRCGASYGGDQC